MRLGEVFRFGAQSLLANKIRTVLTALGLVIGNAAVILVVTISLTGQDYILDVIRGIGSNLVYATYETSGQDATVVQSDYMTLSDLAAVRQALADRIVAATGIMTVVDQVTSNGKPQDISVLGTDEAYRQVRSPVVVAGRFLDASDVETHQRVAVLVDELATRLYGSQQAAIGQTIKLLGLPFYVIGTFREKTSSYGGLEVNDHCLLVPITVVRNYSPNNRVDPIYVQARTSDDVEPVTRALQTAIESRHRTGARYAVRNLNAILSAAKQISVVLSIVLVLVSAITLFISGIGIMNIMLVTVTERTREIGVRMAVGASRREVLQQFLAEAVLISVGGGILGILLGTAVPFAVNFFVPEAHVPLSLTSVFVAFGVSFAVGLLFGLLPANRASKLNPTEALRYE